jgi:ribosomal protein S18 acetylase RimI-like enzyme
MPSSTLTRSAPDTIIRHLEWDDVVGAIRLARAFHAESAYASMPLALAKVDSTILAALNDPDRYCVVLADRESNTIVGYLMAVVCEHYFSYTLTCTDLGFYIEPAYRNPFAARAMLVQLEHWAFVVKGVADISLGVSSGIADEAILRFYARLGYTRGYSGVIKSR